MGSVIAFFIGYMLGGMCGVLTICVLMANGRNQDEDRADCEGEEVETSEDDNS